MVKSVSTVCSEIYDEIRKLAPDMRGRPLLLRVNPEVARALGGDEAGVLREPRGLAGRRDPRAGRPAAAPGAVRRGGRLSEPARDAGSRRTSRRSRRHLARAAGQRATSSRRATSPWRAAGIEAGVPLATVLVASTAPSNATADGPPRRSPAPRGGAGAAAGPRRGARAAERAAARGERAARRPARAAARAAAGAPRRCRCAKIGEVRDLLAVASRPNWDYLRGKLREIDDDVLRPPSRRCRPSSEAALPRTGRGGAVERHRGARRRRRRSRTRGCRAS